MILRETFQVDSREEHAMTAGPRIEPARFWHEQLSHASPDLLRDLLATFVDALMGAEADAICLRKHEIGGVAARLLVAALDNRQEVPDVRRLWAGDLAVRGSTGPAAG